MTQSDSLLFNAVETCMRLISQISRDGHIANCASQQGTRRRPAGGDEAFLVALWGSVLDID